MGSSIADALIAASTLAILSHPPDSAPPPRTHRSAATPPPHIALDLVYSRYYISHKLPAVNVMTRDIRRQFTRAVELPNFSAGRPNLELARYPRLTSVSVKAETRSGHAVHQVHCEDISKATGLTHLSLRSLGLPFDLQPESFDPLARLTRLEHLYITTCVLDSSDFLTSLTGLTALDLTDSCYNIHTTSIAPLTGLRVLDLSRSSISGYDYSGLSSLTGLEVLGLRGQLICNAASSHLEGLAGLKELDLARASISWPATFLRRLTALTRLNLQHTRDWVPQVATLTNLVSLDMSHCFLTHVSVRSLRGLSALTELTLRDNIGNAGARSLAQLTKLQRLSVPFCYIRNHSLLAPLTGLTHLHINEKDGVDYKAMFPALVTN